MKAELFDESEDEHSAMQVALHTMADTLRKEPSDVQIEREINARNAVAEFFLQQTYTKQTISVSQQRIRVPTYLGYNPTRVLTLLIWVITLPEF